jgi:hypothetical protein
MQRNQVRRRAHATFRLCLRLQAGNQIGENFWKMVLAEHGLDNNGVRLFSLSLQVEDFVWELSADRV